MPFSPAQQAWLEAGPQRSSPSPAACLDDWDAIARALGYGAATGRSMPPHVRDTAERMHDQALTLISPQLCWSATTVELNGDTLTCTGALAGSLAIGGIVRAQMRRAAASVIFVVSIGNLLEREARRLMAGTEVLEGFVLDAMGSVAADTCADVLEAELREQLTPLGWRLTNRFSPGYCSWETSDQAALFAMMPPAPAGVSLSASALMQPIKSVSGIIGVGADVKHEPYPCAFCGMVTCHQRLVESRLGADLTAEQ